MLPDTLHSPQNIAATSTADGMTLAERQRIAAERFAVSGWPDRRQEAWKYTSLSSLEALAPTPAESLTATTGFLPDGHHLVFINGHHQPAHDGSLPQGVRITSLEERPDLAMLLDDPAIAEHPVRHRTLSGLGSVIVLEVEAGTDVSAPLHLVFDNIGNGLSSHPLVLISLGEAASLQLAESHYGTDKGLSAPLMLIQLEEKARLDHVRLQQEGMERHHLGLGLVILGSRSGYHGWALQSGGALSRMEQHMRMAGEDAEAHLTAIYLCRDNQISDVTTGVYHDVPSCHSMQTVRGVLDDQARGVFQGKVRVARDAQHTDGNQMSRALLLSRKCEADAKPELEIYADDVTCSHGATVGELDDDQLFYLLSRGIPLDKARQMLIEAFLGEVLDDLESETVREMLAPVLSNWLAANRGEEKQGHDA